MDIMTYVFSLFLHLPPPAENENSRVPQPNAEALVLGDDLSTRGNGPHHLTCTGKRVPAGDRRVLPGNPLGVEQNGAKS